jgi:hypothetical protein
MELITQNLNTLSSIEKQAIQATYHKRVCEMTKMDLIKPLTTAMTKAYVITGQKIPPEMGLMADEFLAAVKTHHKTMTPQEIELAVCEGAAGNLNDQFQVSVRNLLGWITIYKHTIKTNAILKMRKEQEEKDEKTEKEADREKLVRFEQLISELYRSFPKEFKKHEIGELAAMFRHCENKNVVKMTNEEKYRIYDQVLKMYPRLELKWTQLRKAISSEKTAAQAFALWIVFRRMRRSGQQNILFPKK